MSEPAVEIFAEQTPVKLTGIRSAIYGTCCFMHGTKWFSKIIGKPKLKKSPTLDALLALILANLIKQRLRIGLGRQLHE